MSLSFQRLRPSSVPLSERVALCSLCVGEDDGDDKSVQTEGLTENEDQDDSDEDIFLSGSSHTSVTGDTDCEAGSQGGKAAAQAGGEVLVAGVSVVCPGASSNFFLRGNEN